MHRCMKFTTGFTSISSFLCSVLYISVCPFVQFNRVELNNWLIDWLIDLRLASSISTIYNIQIENREGCVHQVNGFNLPLEKYGVCGWTKNIVFWSDYSPSFLFRNLQKRDLMCRKRYTLQSRSPHYGPVRLSVLCDLTPHNETATPVRHMGTRRVLWVLTQGTFTSTQVYWKRTHNKLYLTC